MTLDPVTFRHAFEAIKDLPTLPVVVGEITKRIANPATNAADIGKLIERDQALTSRVLRLVNSSYYGFPRQIKSIKHAVVILGFSKIKSVVITTAVLRAFKKSRANGFDITRFWQHSLAAAISAKALAETFGIGHAAEEAFIGGLLHDIGKVVMEQFQSAIYSPVLQHARDNGLLLLEAEKQLLGLTHDMVGEWMMELWHLPPIIVRMVSDHHNPAGSTALRELVASVAIGDIMARALGVGNGGDERIPAVDPILAVNLGINAVFFDAALVRIIEEILKAADFFTLVTGSD